ncbi:MAG: response regulator transcription factor [Bacteroidota bacterium]
MKILVIEDEPIVFKTIEFKLNRDGYEVISAFDGKDGMEKIVSEKPDFILTDILMPFATGLEIVSFIRKELHSEVPIIVLSGLGQEVTVLEAFELGADDYLVKPFSPNELSIRIKRLLILKNK